MAIEWLLAFYTDDVVQEDVALGVVHRGKDELRRFAERYFANMPDYRMAVRAGFLTETAGAVEWAFTVTHTAQPLSGAPGTGKTLQARAASILGLRDGKISRQTDYWDAATTMRQAGLLPATPTPSS